MSVPPEPPLPEPSPTLTEPLGVPLLVVPTGRRFGEDYEILQRVAAGGMGVVYKARQIKANRLVALKMIQAGFQASPEQVQRFQREAQAAADLHHPGIVTVYDVGELAGQHYFSMEWLGGSLRDLLADGPLPPRLAAELVRQVAEAVEYAHQRGIIHRDLKPANILLQRKTTTDNTDDTDKERSGPSSSVSSVLSVVDFIPKLADFGLARLKEGSDLSRSGQVMGTPSYMPPEQAEGRLREIGPWTDVYGLGAVLYQLLTGRPPFQSASTHETLRQVLQEEPVPPRQVNPAVPRDLETVCLKCLQKLPLRRYRSAGAVAEDLGRFLEGLPVLARPVNWVERTGKWVKRRPAVAGLLGVIVVLVLAGTGLVTWQWRSAVAALQRADRAQKQRAQAQAQSLLEAAPGAVPAILQDLEANRDEVLPRLRELWQETPEPPGRLRLALALLPVDPGLRDDLADWMLQAEDPAEVLLARDALRPHGLDLAPELWRKAEDARTPGESRFRALVALAAFDSNSPRWHRAGPVVVEQLLSANPLHLGPWVQALRRARADLLAPLREVFRGRRLAEMKQTAAIVLADYAADQPEMLAGLFLEADPQQFARLRPLLVAQREQIAPRMKVILQMPAPPPEWGLARGRTRLEEEQWALGQARAAATLLLLGQDEPVWALFRSDMHPERCSQLTWQVGLLGVDSRLLVRRLEQEKHVSARRALIVSLGEFRDEHLPAALREPLTRCLLEWYRDEPDPGIHGAIDWLLRHAREDPQSRPIDWDQTLRLQQLNDGLKQRDPDGRRRWYVNGQGQTMVVLPKPIEFHMGSPLEETDRYDAETPHWRRINRGIALACKPVTVEQFERFLKDRPQVRHQYVKSYSPDPDGPIIGVTWFQAAQYCNWLSEKEGLPREQWCYPEEIKEGMKPYPDHLRRKGYRLPTEAEWESACRAGTLSRRYYGSSDALLPRYAWYLGNSGDRAWPVGQKRPNPLGLFDMHGNVWTWCQEGAQAYPPGTPEKPAEDVEDVRPVVDTLNRSLRGGSYDNLPLIVRSALRIHMQPSYPSNNIGIRPARTLD